MAAWIRSGERVVSVAEVGDRAARAGTGFAQMGIGPNDCVAVFLRNDMAFIEASVAAGLVGAYLTPVNWHNSPDEAGYVFENCGAKAIVIHADLLGQVKEAMPRGVPVFVVPTPPEIAAAYNVPEEATRVPAGATDWYAWLAQFPPRTQGPDEPPGSMIYTSGTTGRPKGVRRLPPTPEQALVAQGMIATIFGYGPWADRPEEIVAMAGGPMYHSTPNGWAGAFFKLGANQVLLPRFDAEETLRLIERHKVTHLLAVPTHFVRLLKLPEEVRRRYDISSLRFVMHGAAPCPIHVKQDIIKWFGPIVAEHYGGTETAAVTYCDSHEWLAHPGTVGRALPNAQVRILGENGEELARGATGEVVCRLMDYPDFTYHGDDEKRRKADRSGLIALGDVGYLDDDGFLYLSGRSSDMVISGGVNIYPVEIEAELHKMPGVRDCAVFGIPDDEFGEQLCAIVQPQGDAHLTVEGVREFLRGRVAGYKVPRRIEFRDELPREDSGKIFKRKLREPFWEAAGRRI
jgi:long-chain acyl-CoA synthetase